MSEEKILTFRGKRVYVSRMVCNICNISRTILNNYVSVVSSASLHLNQEEDFIRIRGKEVFLEFCIENPEFKFNGDNPSLNLYFDSAIKKIKEHRNNRNKDNTILTFRGKRVYLSSMVCNICNIKKTTLNNYTSPSSNILIDLIDNEDILHLTTFSSDYNDFLKENPTVHFHKAAILNLFYESAIKKIKDYRESKLFNRDKTEESFKRTKTLEKTPFQDSFAVDLNKIMIALLNLIQENKQMSNKISILENRILKLERMSMPRQYSQEDNPEDLQSLLSEYLSLKKGA